MKPVPARWFQLVTPKEAISTVLERLSVTGAIELDNPATPSAPLDLSHLGAGLEEFDHLAERFSAYWPPHIVGEPVSVDAPETVMEQSLGTLENWEKEAEPVIARLDEATEPLAELAFLRSLLSGDRVDLPDLNLFASKGGYLEKRLYMLPGKVGAVAVPEHIVCQVRKARGQTFLLCAALPEDLPQLEEEVRGLKGREVDLPSRLPADPHSARVEIENRLARQEASCAAIKAELHDLNAKYDLRTVLPGIERLRWLADHGSDLSASKHLVWVSGWTSDLEGGRLRSELDRCNVPHVLQFSVPPEGRKVPMVFSNPFWARPFEAFARMLGMPGMAEADPSRAVAIIAPLLFGYMFADVGQGLVLMLAGTMLHRRFPLLRLLIPGGAMAMVFGVLFGSIFSLEGIIPALWLHPLEHPATVLLTALMIGVAVVLAGLTLDALQGLWGGRGQLWVRQSAGLVVAYISILIAFFDVQALWLTTVGVLWYLAGTALASRPGERLQGFAVGGSEIVEKLYQIAVNTISFARVGAFALAHAGLSAAITTLAGSVEGAGGFWTIVILGNVLVIGLEGLVAGVQTTRLVLFEFFVRFMRASGRPFRPLAPPTFPVLSYRETAS